MKMEERREVFKEKSREYLQTQNKNDLRVYGRFVGVKTPTSLKKEELVENIIQSFLSKEKIVQFNRGKPPKNNYFPPKILQTLEDLFKKAFGDSVEQISRTEERETVLHLSVQVEKLKPFQKKLLTDFLNSL